MKNNPDIVKNFPVFLLGLIIGALLLFLIKDVIFNDREPQIVLDSVQLVSLGKKGSKPTIENLKNVVVECQLKKGKWELTNDISFKTKNGRSLSLSLKQIVSICCHDNHIEIETVDRWYKPVSFLTLRIQGQSENVQKRIFELQTSKEFFIGIKREITGNTCLNYVQFVKNSFLKDFQMATIGDAFDSYFLNPGWNGIQLPNGARAVSFNGKRNFRRGNIYVNVLFVINVDKKIQVRNAEIIFTRYSWDIFQDDMDDDMFLERFLGYTISIGRKCKRYFKRDSKGNWKLGLTGYGREEILRRIYLDERII